jgi:hypothetical protein
MYERYIVFFSCFLIALIFLTLCSVVLVLVRQCIKAGEREMTVVVVVVVIEARGVSVKKKKRKVRAKKLQKSEQGSVGKGLSKKKVHMQGEHHKKGERIGQRGTEPGVDQGRRRRTRKRRRDVEMVDCVVPHFLRVCRTHPIPSHPIPSAHLCKDQKG